MAKDSVKYSGKSAFGVLKYACNLSETGKFSDLIGGLSYGTESGEVI